MKRLFFLLILLPALHLFGQTGENCKLTIYLKGDDNSIITDQKFKLSFSGGDFIGEFVTDAQGKATIQLKKNTKFTFETLVNGRTMRTDFAIDDEDQVAFELQLAVSKQQVIDSVKVIFHVTDDRGIVETEAKIIVKDGTRPVFSCTTDVDGYCYVTLKRGIDYTLQVEKFGKTFDLDLDMPKDPDLTQYTLNLKIKVVERYTRTFVLENVYFDYNKWDIKPEAHTALNNLYDMLVSDPGMKIEIGGHTDSDGNDASNMQLSQRRADAVKQYLVNKGIASNRLLTKGYGETSPIATNDTDEGKAKNRRTEIKVISE